MSRGREKTQQRGTKSASFRFFESFDSQKQPETAQKVDLRLRDVNPDVSESKIAVVVGVRVWKEGGR